jgi:hypothetical protein
VHPNAPSIAGVTLAICRPLHHGTQPSLSWT